MNDNYRSSIVIPVYNAGIALKEAVESVLLQSNGKDEIVIVDDVSTDQETLNIIEELNKLPNIKVIHQKSNKGPSAARTEGINSVNAEIIVLLDADDKLAPDYLEKMLLPFSDPEVAFTYCDLQCFGDYDDVWHSGPLDPAKVVESQLIGGCSPFRKSVFKAVGGFCGEKRNEDWDFWLSVCAKGYKGIYIPEALYLYRRHGENRSSDARIYAPAVHQRMFDRHKEFILKYMTKEQFMAWAYHQAGFAHLKTGEPLTSLKYGAKLLLIPERRFKGIEVFLAIAKHIIKRL